jgi:hypothetical protein
VSDDHLDRVSGGLQINPTGNQPKPKVPVSIAQGDSLDNTLTFDQLPNG